MTAKDCTCDMKGFLSFLILWLLRTRSMNGATVAEELGKRKGQRPSPGTLYPALKALQQKGLIRADDGKEYSLTPRGREELERTLHVFTQIFADFKEMQGCCSKAKA